MTTYRIGLAMERESGFARSVLKGIADAIQLPDKSGIVLDIRFMFINPNGREVRNIDGYDGYLVQVFDDDFAKRLLNTGKPVVDVFVAKRRPGISAVECDHRAIAELAANHFLDHAFSAFAFCGFYGAFFSDERERNFAEVLADRGFACNCYRPGKGRTLKMNGHFDPMNEYIERPSDYCDMKRWADTLARGTAVFCCNDQRACQLIRICQEMGIHIPEDLAILGVDDEVLFCNFMSPKLSSIANNPELCGMESVKLLKNLLRRPAKSNRSVVRKILPAFLVERESTNLYCYEPKWLADAVRFIHTNISRNLTASEVIAMTGVSHTTVEAEFHKVLGISVQEEIINTRYREAMRLLAETDLDIGEVANRSGFGSLNYFSTNFTKHCHCAPSRYRKRHKKPLA